MKEQKIMKNNGGKNTMSDLRLAKHVSKYKPIVHTGVWNGWLEDH